MLSKEETVQYHRHLILENLGLKGQEKLKKSAVLVVGAGGLGAPVLQYLAAAGVGRIGIIDGDVVDASNLQRQVVFTQEDIGSNKAIAAKYRLEALNPFIKIEVYNEFITVENALDVCKRYDLVVDGSDNFQTRYLVNDACVLVNKPFVFGSIFKFEGQVSVFNWKNGPTYRCLYPSAPGPEEVPNCSEIGVLGVLPGVIGSIMANEALKLMAELGEPLSGSLLLYDALKLRFQELKVQKTSIEVSSLLEDYDAFCGVAKPPKAINAIELFNWMKENKKFQLIDVRESYERQICSLDSLHLPMNSVLSHANKIAKDIPVVLYCHHGVRSQMVINSLLEQGFQNLVNLEGGIHQWAIDVDPEMAIY